MLVSCCVLGQIHQFIDGMTDETLYPADFGFRLLFNGKVMNVHMDGCPNNRDLCDIEVLIDRISPFAVRDRPHCAVPPTPAPAPPPALETAANLSKSSGGIALVIVVVLLSAIVGAIGGIYLHTNVVRRRATRPAKFTSLPSEGGDSQFRDFPDNNDDDDDGEMIEIPRMQIA